MIATPSTTPHTGQDYLQKNPTGTETRSPNQSLLPLTANINSRDNLEIGGCDLKTLVEQFGSPLYILDEITLRTACRQYRDFFQTYYQGESQVIYASKAWSSLAVVAVIATEDLGFDVVSGGELHTTQKALTQMGYSNQEIAQKIYFHGNNKSVAELKQAIEIGCTIIVDNWVELQTIPQLAQNLSQQTIPILIRLTPGIECHTHDYIRTGHLDSKFGFDPNQIEAVFSYIAEQKSLDCRGLHAHIGSQIFERQPHQDLAGVLVEWLKIGQEYGLTLPVLNIGGGLGIRYTEEDDPPSIEEWVKAVSEAVMKACQRCGVPLPKLIAEPGRSLIGSACVTAYTVGSQKEIPELRTYIAVDGGMSDNPRPITYQSAYSVVLGNKMSAQINQTVTIAGKHCESGDILIKDAQLPQTHPGDILVIMGTGAYNYSMASNYNRLPRPAAVLVNNGEANLILRRETYDDLIRQDCLPQKLLS
ncbi:diaminopimelate decarboxylase [Crocosphaera sp. Alani8]|uniref:diaminopimelate decarboxylase n=1 Tax=Crocosphaera sp. Alani8 TaxID=3038952 RepID=UPI00313F0300